MLAIQYYWERQPVEDTREDTREPRNRSRCHRKMLKDVILVFVWKPSCSNHPFALRLHARLSWCQVIIGGEDEFLLLLDSQQMIVYGDNISCTPLPPTPPQQMIVYGGRASLRIPPEGEPVTLLVASKLPWEVNDNAWMDATTITT